MQPDADTQAFIDTCDEILELRKQGAPTTHLEEGLTARLAPLRGTPEIVAAIVAANLPRQLAYLLERDGPGRYNPHSTSKEGYKMVRALMATGAVDAALDYIASGGTILFRPGDDLPQSIVHHDCPRRLALFVALRRQAFYFEEDLVAILQGAGPRLARALIDLDDPARMDPHLSLVIGARPLEDITLKEFAVLISGKNFVRDFFILSEFERDVPEAVARIAQMKHSNHGLMELERLEPSRINILTRPADEQFYNLESPTLLVKDAVPLW